MDECDHGSPPQICPVCKNEELRKNRVSSPRTGLRRGAAATNAVILAMHPGMCFGCDEPISRGERITWSDDSDNWVHEGCA